MQLSDKAKALVEEKYKDGHKKRLEHIFGVAEMAEFLAKRYNVDVEKAKVAAYMHDYSKYDDPKDALGILKEEEIKECQEYPFLYHAYLSAEAYKRLMDFDIDIYNAIKYHVFGRPNMSILEAIIMIADYTEKNRVYPSCIEVRKILVDDNNLNLAIYESLVRTIDFELKEGHKAHPMQIKVKEEYKRKVLEDELRRSNNWLPWKG